MGFADSGHMGGSGHRRVLTRARRNPSLRFARMLREKLPAPVDAVDRPRPTRVAGVAVLVAAMALIAAGCNDDGKELDDPVFPPPATTVVATSLPSDTQATVLPVAPMALVAPWVDGSPIPERHTCAGAGLSPALTWSNVPPGTVELAISVVDLDAGQYVHWLVYGVSPLETGVVEGQLPELAFEWPNSSGSTAWSAPCPPAGEEHRYVITLYALNQQLESADDAPATEVLSNLNAISIAQSTVSGTVTG